MPIANTTLLVVRLQLRSKHKQSEPERLLELATTGLNYLGNLDHITSMLSLDKMPELMHGAEELHKEALVDDYRSALFTLGELQAGIAEAVYDNVTALYELFTESKSE